MGTFLEDTLAVWQPYYEQELTQRDGEEIASNWSAFLNIVAEWMEARQEG